MRAVSERYTRADGAVPPKKFRWLKLASVASVCSYFCCGSLGATTDAPNGAPSGCKTGAIFVLYTAKSPASRCAIALIASFNYIISD